MGSPCLFAGGCFVPLRSCFGKKPCMAKAGTFAGWSCHHLSAVTGMLRGGKKHLVAPEEELYVQAGEDRGSRIFWMKIRQIRRGDLTSSGRVWSQHPAESNVSPGWIEYRQIHPGEKRSREISWDMMGRVFDSCIPWSFKFTWAGTLRNS